MRTTKLLVAAGTAVGLLLATPAVASAHPHPSPNPVLKSDPVAAPFNLALSHGRYSSPTVASTWSAGSAARRGYRTD